MKRIIHKYKNKASVLPFNVVYDRVLEFLAPFISGADDKYIIGIDVNGIKSGE